NILADSSGHVCDALACAKTDLGAADEDARASELSHAGLKADTCTQRRFLENQGENAIQKRGRGKPTGASGLQLRGYFQQFVQFLRGNIKHVEEMLHSEYSS